MSFNDWIQHSEVFKLLERLQNLEKSFTCFKQDKDSFLNLIERIEKLEKCISNWEEEFYFLKDKLRSPNSLPHKCPVCAGCGKDGNVLLSMPPKFIDCHACEGKGIVWG